jgi:hypothetical protein
MESSVCQKCGVMFYSLLHTCAPARNDPTGRLDILALRLGEAAAHWAESWIQRKIGLPVKIWDGQDGLGEVIKTKVEEMGFGEPVPMTPASLAEHLGFIKKRKPLKRVS